MGPEWGRDKWHPDGAIGPLHHLGFACPKAILRDCEVQRSKLRLNIISKGEAVLGWTWSQLDILKVPLKDLNSEHKGSTLCEPPLFKTTRLIVD